MCYSSSVPLGIYSKETVQICANTHVPKYSSVLCLLLGRTSKEINAPKQGNVYKRYCIIVGNSGGPLTWKPRNHGLEKIFLSVSWSPQGQSLSLHFLLFRYSVHLPNRATCFLCPELTLYTFLPPCHCSCLSRCLRTFP